MNFYIHYPVRGRPQKALDTLRRYVDTSFGEDFLDFLVVMDSDDAETIAAFTPEAIRAITAGKHCIAVGTTIRPPRSKIAACQFDRMEAFQAGLLQMNSPDVYMLISDDMIPAQNWDQIIRKAFQPYAKDMDVCLHFNDGHTGQRLCTLPIMGHARFTEFGYFYHPEYLSLWCDNEYTEVHKPVYFPQVIIEHMHPANGQGREDDLYRANNALDATDRKTYHRRKAAGFPREQPILSIGIPTIPERAVDLRRLMIVLQPQLARISPGQVELVIEYGEGTTGEKRNRILDRANGEYIAFIDDDDLVPADYVARIFLALAENPGVDCIGFKGEMTTDGIDPWTFIHALDEKRSKEWTRVYETRTYYRPPNHLNPVRIDLARRAGFPDKARGEDFDYSQALFPLLRTTVFLDGDPMYYYLFNPARKPLEREIRAPLPAKPKPVKRFVPSKLKRPLPPRR